MLKHNALFMFFLAASLASGTAAQATAPTHADTPAPTYYYMTPEELVLIKNQPLSVLAKFANNGAAMAEYIANAVVADPSVVTSLLSVANDTSSAQASAMGAGIARGARIISTKDPVTAKQIAEKVEHSDKMQLKVTFEAIGPSYKALLVPNFPPIIPPSVVSDNKPIGTRLDIARSRVGPEFQPFTLPQEKHPNRVDNNPFEDRNDGVMVMDYVVFNAILASDAQHNGAVSTSPTR